ncbi:hypothetical protein V6N11_003117 [Hibiscus sabdariffa]|uniref:Single-stranded DNA binding protein Ssb-like OB fold domain-containing protein n=1 Tax=Hibiscus sabdariffa TaxID=183260 RepID=A0ABR2SD54_9ROSI
MATTGQQKRQGQQQQEQQQGLEQNKTTEKRKPVFVKVDQLKPGTNGHTLISKVLSSNMVVQKDRAASRNLRQTRIAECLVGDETGTILFTARNDQVDLMKPGDTVIFRNAKIDMFKGSMRLAVDKWGRIEVTDPANFVVKEDNNLSLVEQNANIVGATTTTLTADPVVTEIGVLSGFMVYGSM